MKIEDHPYYKEFSENMHHQMIGKSAQMLEIIREIEHYAQYDVTINLIGETGTGKELAAKALHKLSSRKDFKFVAKNCGVDTESILEAELFGTEKGIATGVGSNPGLILSANNGTLFLDEIVSMSPKMQVSLLRVLQEREVQKVGNAKEYPVDFRLITASSNNLAESVKNGIFREDLYMRINVVPIVLPPLRERKGDIELLAKYLCAKYCHKHKLSLTLNKTALIAITNYEWPGNVRELECAMERAVTSYGLNARNNQLYSEDFLFLEAIHPVIIGSNTKKTKGAIALAERNQIIKTLGENEYNKTRTAEILGIDRRTLYRKIELYGIKTRME